MGKRPINATKGCIIRRKKRIKNRKIMKTRTEIIKELLKISPKRKDINYFNELTNMTDSQLEAEYSKWVN